MTAFALLPQALIVLFRNGAAYLYDNDRPGPAHVNRMCQLAQSGRGLSTYISQHVGTRYAASLSQEQVRTLRRL